MGCTSIIEIKREQFKKVGEIGQNANICHSFLITSIETDKEYAYKIINTHGNEEMKKKILNDIEILKNLNHPNIIQLKDSFYSSDKKYLNIVTEYADGGDLQKKLIEQKKKNEFFEEEKLLNWFMQVCLALKYIHKKNIIHRDIKPSNIFLMKENTDDFAKLGDFGVAKQLDSHLMYAKTNVATPQYSAPEIIEGKKYSFNADIWSLGVTFYQLMILDFPFEGSTNEEMQKNIIEGKKKEIPKDCNFSQGFIEIINKMLSFRPDERPSAKEILKKGVINTRIEGYLNRNGFDLKNADEEIKNYKKDKKDELEKIKIVIIEEDEDNFSINDDRKKRIEDRKKRIEENRNLKAHYDFNRQMTFLSKELIKKSKTFPKIEN